MGRAIWGALLTLAGSVGLTGLVFIANCGTDGCERAKFGLGLAGTALVSALLQVAVLVGLWLLWSSRQR